MGLYAVPTTDSDDPAALRDATGHGRAVARRRAPGGTAVSTDGVSEAHLGRALAMQRRRQLSKGKQALNGDGTAATASGAPVFVVHRGRAG